MSLYRASTREVYFLCTTCVLLPFPAGDGHHLSYPPVLLCTPCYLLFPACSIHLVSRFHVSACTLLCSYPFQFEPSNAKQHIIARILIKVRILRRRRSLRMHLIPGMCSCSALEWFAGRTPTGLSASLSPLLLYHLVPLPPSAAMLVCTTSHRPARSHCSLPPVTLDFPIFSQIPTITLCLFPFPFQSPSLPPTPPSGNHGPAAN